MLHVSSSYFGPGSGLPSILKACWKQFLPIVVYCNFRITAVTFKESLMPFQVHPKNKWSCCSEFCAQCLCSIESVPPRQQTRHVWRCWVVGGYTMMSHTGNIGVGAWGGLGTSQGWLLFHRLTSSSVKINRQSEYSMRVHNDIVDFHA